MKEYKCLSNRGAWVSKKIKGELGIGMSGKWLCMGEVVKMWECKVVLKEVLNISWDEWDYFWEFDKLEMIEWSEWHIRVLDLCYFMTVGLWCIAWEKKYMYILI